MFSPKCAIFIVFAISLVSEVILVNRVDGLIVEPTNEFLLRFEENLLSEVKNELATVNITYIKQILPNVFLFRDNGTNNEMPEVLKNNTELNGKVSRFERVHEYIAELWTKSAKTTENDSQTTDGEQKSRVSTYFDMGVEGAWRQNYTGKGILIAVTDVGVNPDVKDLQPNIDTKTSYNSVDDSKSTDIRPEQFDDNPETMSTTDHGNRCAGMISALRNDLCGDGVAYDAKIAVLKIFEAVEANSPQGRIKLKYPSIANGIYHGIDNVDIYSNSWGHVKDFAQNFSEVDVVMEAIEDVTTQGRGGKGAIHVFPVDKLADPFSNSIYTIAVNSMSQNGGIPKFSHVCACTLTTAYGEGCGSLVNPECDTSHMMTASRRGCTLDFQGTSASTAIVSAIVGLALQANPNLSWREVQDIIVRASERKRGMAEYNHFLMNGSGKYYHPVFGFGLLNATTLVTLAENMQPLLQQVKITMDSSTAKSISGHKYVEAYVTIPCSDTLCVKSLEHVVVMINFSTPRTDYCEIMLISPAGTSSLLMDKRQASNTGPQHYIGVEFLSVHFWGEMAAGQWTLVLKQDGNFAQGSFGLSEFRLSLYGTGVGTMTRDVSTPTATGVSESDTMSTNKNGSPVIVLLFLGIVGLAAILFIFGFRKQLKVKCQNTYSSMKDVEVVEENV